MGRRRLRTRHGEAGRRLSGSPSPYACCDVQYDDGGPGPLARHTGIVPSAIAEHCRLPSGACQPSKGLGYELEPGKNFSVEIKGYTQEYRDAASARSFQITDQMEEKGIGGAEAAERIAHQTREGKQV